MPDLLLLLETSGPSPSVALAQATGGTWAVLAKAPHADAAPLPIMRHTEQLLPLIRSVLPEGGWERLAAVATSSGPGSYTALRAGLSSAKGICLARGLPLLQASTMWGLAARGLGEVGLCLRDPADLPKFETPIDADARVLALLPARRDEVYAAVYEGPELREAMAPTVVQNDLAWRERLLASGISAVCTPDERLLGGFDASPAKPVLVELEAVNLLWECKIRMAENRYDDLAATVPNYVRPPYITQAKTRL